MIRIKIKDKNSREKEMAFLLFKKAVSFNLKKYRSGMYFKKKKK